MNRIYTIGYSSFTLQGFIEILKSTRITAVADVRTVPYSEFYPDFNKKYLYINLKQANIAYVFLGKECGARPNNMHCYKDNKVEFDLLTKTPEFLDGIRRLKNGRIKYSIALMCAEKDPIDCHRMILISNYLTKIGIEVSHILSNGDIETQSQAEKRLLKNFHLTDEGLPNLGKNEQERIQEAYKKQELKIAYKIQEKTEFTNEYH